MFFPFVCPLSWPLQTYSENSSFLNSGLALSEATNCSLEEELQYVLMLVLAMGFLIRCKKTHPIFGQG